MRNAIVITASVVLLAGCQSMAANDKAIDDVRPGGGFDQRTQATMKERAGIKNKNVELSDKKMLVEREIERMDQRIASAQAEGVQRDAELQAAVDQKKITRAKYDELKRQQSALQGELASLKLKDAADRSKAQGRPTDPAAEAEKEKKLAALKQRQKALEADLKKALNG